MTVTARRGRRRADRTAPRPAAHPRHAVRIDRLVRRQGVGEWRRTPRDWESFVANDVVHAVDGHFRTIRSPRARGIGGLSEGGYGAINIAIHHPGEFGLVESWSGYERADDLGSIFGHRRVAADQEHSARHARVRRRPALRRTHTFFWLYTGRDDRFFGQNVTFASLLERDDIAHRLRIVHGGHNWALWRGNARPRTWRRASISGGCHCCVSSRSAGSCSPSPRDSGWLYLVRAGGVPDRTCGRRCRSMSSRSMRRRRSRGSSSSGSRAALLLAAARTMGARRAADRRARARTRHVRASSTSRPGSRSRSRARSRHGMPCTWRQARRRLSACRDRRDRRGGVRPLGRVARRRAPAIVAAVVAARRVAAAPPHRCSQGDEPRMLRIYRPKRSGPLARAAGASAGSHSCSPLADSHVAAGARGRWRSCSRRSQRSCTLTRLGPGALVSADRADRARGAARRLRLAGRRSDAVVIARRALLALTAIAAYGLAADLAQPARRRPAVHPRLRRARDARRPERAARPRLTSPRGSFGAGSRFADADRPRRDRLARRRLACAVALPRQQELARPPARARARAPVRRRHARAVRAPPRQGLLLQRRAATRSSPTASRWSRDRLGRSDRTTPDCVRRARRPLRRPRARARLAGGDPRRVRALARPVPRARPAGALPRRRGSRRHRARSRSKAARSARYGSRFTGCTKAGYSRALPCVRARSGRTCAASSKAITADWRGDQPERGFAMASTRSSRSATTMRCSSSASTSTEGAADSSISQSRPPVSALSLSSMPRLREATPNGFNEWLICETVAWAREHGYALVSLNFSPFAALLAPEAELSGRRSFSGWRCCS